MVTWVEMMVSCDNCHSPPILPLRVRCVPSACADLSLMFDDLFKMVDDVLAKEVVVLQ